jgi:hypothetical protein
MLTTPFRRNPNTLRVIRHFDPCGKRATFPLPARALGVGTQSCEVTSLGFSTPCGGPVDEGGTQHGHAHRNHWPTI